MNYFIFILGSNWKLSLAELDYCLKNSRFKGRIIDYSATAAIVEFESLLEQKYFINELMEFQYLLGGVQKIGKAAGFIDYQSLRNAFPEKIGNFKRVKNEREKIRNILNSVVDDVFLNIKNKEYFFAVSLYPIFFDDKYYTDVLIKHFLPFLNKEIMSLLFEKGAKKALYYKYPEKYIAEGTLNPIFPHHVITYNLLTETRAEIIFSMTEEGIYIGRTFTTDDPNFKRKIDAERPHKDFKSSIPPKLALILLNFLNLFENRHEKKILDPFVGNGMIFLMAFLQDFDVYGADLDKQRVINTQKNIEWLSKELNQAPPKNLQEKLIVSDVKDLPNRFPPNYFDGIVSEPFMGPFYVEKPYYTEIKGLIHSQLNPLFHQIFESSRYLLKKGGRISITSPLIHALDGGALQPDLQRIAQETGFITLPLMDTERIINKSDKRLRFSDKNIFSLIDAKKDQIIMRKFHVFEKQ
ncbi:MAG: TRM11 family SAM-dependent methyltransferase [Promethearchaeota archaeon]